MQLKPISSLPFSAMPRKQSGMSQTNPAGPARAQQFNASKLQQKTEQESARVSMNQLQRMQQYNQSLGKTDTKSSTSFMKPGSLGKGLSGGGISKPGNNWTK